MKLATLNDLKKKGEDDDKKKTDTELFVGGLDNRGGGSGKLKREREISRNQLSRTLAYAVVMP